MTNIFTYNISGVISNTSVSTCGEKLVLSIKGKEYQKKSKEKKIYNNIKPVIKSTENKSELMSIRFIHIMIIRLPVDALNQFRVTSAT